MQTKSHNSNFVNLPLVPGVYIMRDNTGKIIYIGKANNLKKRVSSYFKSTNDFKTQALIRSLRHIDYIIAQSESDALVLERQLINRFKPYYNSMWRDDKSYPYLKITTKEDFPRLIIIRKLTKDGSNYFGPFPQVTQLKSLLRWLHKIFKWRYCNIDFSAKVLPKENKIKSCIYLQTTRCPAPCIGKISSNEYKKNIKEVQLLLKGKYKNLMSLWEKQMQIASQKMEFEKAAEIRDRINNLNKINEKVTLKELKPEDFTIFLESGKTLKELKEKLNLSKWPVIIEGFDISNIQGTNPVGSMVRFYNGKPDKDNYRKFKIKTVPGIDDVAMIKETVKRRYKRLRDENKKLPDLILIDGGKGQLFAAHKTLEDLKLKIPIISIAKKEEDILSPEKTEPIKLPKDSSVLHLLQSIRDEAHRFAHSYHILRRKKKLYERFS